MLTGVGSNSGAEQNRPVTSGRSDAAMLSAKRAVEAITRAKLLILQWSVAGCAGRVGVAGRMS